MEEVRTRFAPSPTGYMHIGNLRSALYAYLFARSRGGRFLLRIEDTDQDRFVDGAIDLIYRTMRDVGMDYDEGPDIGGDYGPYVQSERKNLYMPYAEQLIASGHAYRCFCTKEELEERRQQARERGETFKYDKHCKHLTQAEIDEKLKAGVEYVIRQDVPTEGQTTFEDMLFGSITVDNSTLDDNVLIKADGMPTYNFANVIDDHLMKISHVMRGMEYLSSTPKYNLLYEALGFEIPKYIHMPPIMRDAQRKLSKRDGDASYEDFINKGYLKDAIINYIALLGWSPGDDRERFTMQELIDAFDVSGMSKSPAIFDPLKLTWLNAQYIRDLSPEEFTAHAREWYHKAGIGEMDEGILQTILQPRVEYFSQIPDMVSFLVKPDEFNSSMYVNKKSKTDPEVARTVITEAMKRLKDCEWTHESIQNEFEKMCEDMQLKKGTVMYPVRIAMSGRAVTPGGAVEIALLLGREESLLRLDKGLQII